MKQSDWYKHNWTLDIKNESWTEDTENQVRFIIGTLELTGNERILDLACGYGRHSLALARRGFSVTGVDITEAYVDDAKKCAKEQSLDSVFIHSDIRDVSFREEFDVVLSLADGAIGYLEDDRENLKIFDVISAALKPGGKHFMDVCNREYAERNFPKTNWEVGESSLALAQFEWDSEACRMKYAGYAVPYGEIFQKPQINMDDADPIRLYSISELENILKQRNMRVISTFSDYYGNAATDRELQLMVYSVKQ